MATKLQVYKNALLILKESSAFIITVSTDSVPVNALNAVYASALAFLLENGKWNFAARSVSIEAETDVEPAFGFDSAFEKPSDYVNLIKLSASSTFYPPFDSGGYVDEGNYWYANIDPLYVSYVSDHDSYGGDLSLWPQVVANALEYELAWRVAPVLTSMGEQAMDQLEKRKYRSLQKAKSWDASKQPPEQLAPSRLALARKGKASWREGWWP